MKRSEISASGSFTVAESAEQAFGLVLEMIEIRYDRKAAISHGSPPLSEAPKVRVEGEEGCR